jgi:hypothetical protein
MTVGDALVALRAHAFATNTTLSDLAVRVIIRQISFDPNFRAWRDVDVAGE